MPDSRYEGTKQRISVTVGKTMQVLLPDGNARGVRITEIITRTIQAIAIPRSQLHMALDRRELANVDIFVHETPI